MPITNLLSYPVVSSNIAPPKKHNVFNQWSRLAERSGGKIYTYGPSEWDSHIILLELQCCIIHFYCPAPKKPDAYESKSCHYCLLFSLLPSILHLSLLTSLWHHLTSPHLTLALSPLLHPFVLVINSTWPMTFSAWFVCLLPCLASGLMGTYP